MRRIRQLLSFQFWTTFGPTRTHSRLHKRSFQVLLCVILTSQLLPAIRHSSWEANRKPDQSWHQTQTRPMSKSMQPRTVQVRLPDSNHLPFRGAVSKAQQQRCHHTASSLIDLRLTAVPACLRDRRTLQQNLCRVLPRTGLPILLMELVLRR